MVPSLVSKKLIIVDEDDNIIEYVSKKICHRGQGLLHRAFSIFIFNDQNDLLIQRRSVEKPLWPLYWSNSVCSHPRKGEEYEDAAHRRLEEELRIKTTLKYLFKFQYHAQYKNIGSENEVCCVFIGKSDENIQPNKSEIEEWKYINLEDLTLDLKNNSNAYTPWFKMEWDQIRKNYNSAISKLWE